MTATAQLRAFGADPSTARIRVTPRSARWRLSRAMLFGLAGYSVMLLAILPPHALWALAGLVAGTAFATHKFLERYTLDAWEGVCPHCGEGMSSDGSSRLKERSTITCDACRRTSELVIDVPGLDAAR